MKSKTRATLVALLVLEIALYSSVSADVFVSDFANDNVLRYNANSGAFVEEFVSTLAGGLDAPRGVAFGPDGSMYVASSGNDSVLSYDGNTGAFLDVFAADGAPELNTP